MFNSKIKIGALIFVILMLNVAFIPAVSAKNVMSDDSITELEQGLVDALNSNTKKSSPDEVIATYFESNKEKVLKNNLMKSSSLSSEENERTYKLNDGSRITFTDDNYFFISGIEEEGTQLAVTTRSSTTTQVLAYKHFYSVLGIRLFSIYASGEYEYDGNTVTADHDNSWYTRGTLSVWQVSNWEEGDYDSSSGTLSEIYGRGNFHWGVEYQGSGIVIEDKYITVKSRCDEDGNIDYLWSAY